MKIPATSPYQFRSARIRSWARWALPALLVALLGSGVRVAAAEERAGEVEEPAARQSPSDGSDEAGSDADASTEKRVIFKPRDVEEIIVMGEPMRLPVQDQTVSVIAFDPDAIKAEGISDIRDLSNFTPSLQIKSAFAASNPTIFIRGVGLDDFNANSQSAVAIYQDGVYMQSPAGQLFQFFDLDGVDVLRGPQPTLFRNAEAGAILVASKKPTEEFDGYLTTTYGNFDLFESEGAFGGPIIPERLLGRVSASWGIRDGITDNRCANREPSCDLSQPAPDGSLQYDFGMDDETNNADAWATRGQLLLRLPSGFETDSDMEWLANVHGGQNRSRALQFQHRGARFTGPTGEVPVIGGGDESGYKDTDGDPFAGDYNQDGPEDIDLFGSNLNGTWPLGGGIEIHSLTAYEWHDRFTHENSDASPRFVLESKYEDTSWQLSEELELRGDWDSLIAWDLGEGEWRLGAYYIQDDLDVTNNFDAAGTGTAQHLTQEYTQETRNLSGFAYSEYHFRPGCKTFLPCDFTLIGGFRYNIERKSFDTSVCEQAVVQCDRSTIEGNDAETWTGPGGEISLAWDFTETSSIYAKYSHGWKSGHFNGGATSIFDIITGVDPETVDSYEGGLRSFWFDDRLMLNVTGFYYDYQDLQVFIIEQTDLGYPIPKLVNAEEATIYGIEVDLGAEPIPDLNITFNFAWVESEYADFKVNFTEKIRLPRPCRTCPFPDPPFLLAPREFDYTGNPLIGSPRHSVTGTIDYQWYLPGQLFGQGLGSLTPRYSLSWRDDVYFDQCSGRGQRCNFPKGFFGQEAYWVHNAALTWRSENEHFEVQGWVHNFLDEHYKSQNFDLTKGLGIILDAFADPRTYGISVTYNF
jgi:iron complex outermembrane receptor protein